MRASGNCPVCCQCSCRAREIPVNIANHTRKHIPLFIFLFTNDEYYTVISLVESVYFKIKCRQQTTRASQQRMHALLHEVVCGWLLLMSVLIFKEKHCLPSHLRIRMVIVLLSCVVPSLSRLLTSFSNCQAQKGLGKVISYTAPSRKLNENVEGGFKKSEDLTAFHLNAWKHADCTF